MRWESARCGGSPIIERTRQTAEVVAQRLGLSTIESDALLELDFGQWTRRSFEDLESEPRWANFNAFRSGTRIPGGELMLETQARVVGLILELRDTYPNEHVALVTHGDVIKAALAYFLGMPLDLYARLEISPASCSELEVGRNFVRVLNLNLTASE
jgi:broad specificity phosphatase PhoE